MAVKKREHERARDVLVSNIDGQGKETFDWKRIWKLPLPNKVWMFTIWRLAHNRLAVHRNIARRGGEKGNNLSNVSEYGRRLWAPIF